MSESLTRYPKELLDAAEALTTLVAADRSFEETMSQLSNLSVEAIDGADGCCVSLTRAGGKELKTVASTGPVGDKIDALQRETGEGPCMTAIEKIATFHIPDMEQDETWPTFSRRAADETGIKSMLSFVLKLSDQETGAMNMLSTKKDSFSDEDLDAGTLFAAQAAVAMADALGHAHDEKKIGELEEGMKTRQTIGEAVGILMVTRQVTADDAFQILRKASQNSNLKLRDIAEKVVEQAPDM